MCGLGGSGYCLGDGEKSVKKPLGKNSGILRQHLFGALWGEYVKTSTFIWSSFVYIY